MPKLPREEYIEQAYLFRGLNHRIEETDPVQTVMKHLRDEILTTSKLPMAIDFMLAELSHQGVMSTAMYRLAHYFTPFQAFVMAAAEDERGRFSMDRALLILEHEARFRAEDQGPVSMFLFQFETICENNLDYDRGLAAMSQDVVYTLDWQKWILGIRHKIGIVGIADLIYVHSQFYADQQQRQHETYGDEVELPDLVLFAEKEGRIALANRGKEPRYLFSALQRQLNYPALPKPDRKSAAEEILPKLQRKMERFEARLKLLEDETKDSGIDLSKYYKKD